MQTFYFVAERTATIRGCTSTINELVKIQADSFRKADNWINENYKGWIHWQTLRPEQDVFEADRFCSYIA